MSSNSAPISEIAGSFSAGRGLRTVWSIEDDYTFVHTLSKNTICNDKDGLILNHKYVEPSIISFVQKLLNQKLSIGNISQELAQKFPNKSQDLRSIGCLKLLIELKSNLSDFSYSQLNHKHINMWTRSIVPFRNLFSTGSLFKGKSRFHKDCKRFAKCLLEFLVYEQAIGDKDNYANIFAKGPSQGSKLLEQWLNAMFKVHGKKMASFLLCCSTKLAHSFVGGLMAQKASGGAEKSFLERPNPSISELIPVLRSYLAQINDYIGERNDTAFDYNAHTVMQRKPFEAPAPVVFPRVANNVPVMEPGHYAGAHPHHARERCYEPSMYPPYPDYREPYPAHYAEMHEYPSRRMWHPSDRPMHVYPPGPSYDYEPGYSPKYAYERPDYVSREYMVARERGYPWPSQRSYEQHHYAREQAAAAAAAAVAASRQGFRHPSVAGGNFSEPRGYAVQPRGIQYRGHPYARPGVRSYSPVHAQENANSASQVRASPTKKIDSSMTAESSTAPASAKQSPVIAERNPVASSNVAQLIHKEFENTEKPGPSPSAIVNAENTATSTPIKETPEENTFQSKEFTHANTEPQEQSPKKLEKDTLSIRALSESSFKCNDVKLSFSSDKPGNQSQSNAATAAKNLVVIANNKVVQATEADRSFSVYKFRYPTK
ncbi:hypothetical protein GGF40_003367 [Coemansia sp. RSA 1286]|nr:hypothetical protein GGF40_003367 [Coemansia sp. RSA 1286]